MDLFGTCKLIVLVRNQVIFLFRRNVCAMKLVSIKVNEMKKSLESPASLSSTVICHQNFNFTVVNIRKVLFVLEKNNSKLKLLN